MPKFQFCCHHGNDRLLQILRRLMCSDIFLPLDLSSTELTIIFKTENSVDEDRNNVSSKPVVSPLNTSLT